MGKKDCLIVFYFGIYLLFFLCCWSLWFVCEHDLECVFMCLVGSNVVACHIQLHHHSLINLIVPECKDWYAIPESPIDVYQVECLELFLCLLFLCCPWKPLLDEKGCTLGRSLGYWWCKELKRRVLQQPGQ